MIRDSDSGEERDMKPGRSLLAILAVCAAGVVLPRTAAADEWNRRTVLTFNKAVEIPGKVLPAGTYVFELADLPASRHVVRVFDRDGRILATVFTISTLRRTAAGGTRITFEEQPANAGFPIKKWFYPGHLDGEEFVYRTRAR
jgi:hypothetical protein